ncbi:S1 RNA-binding domain-containing protein [Blautia liquoris]|jgi:small subunit ribosomal protein S1|uniref:S1 RNA-binding domain-containing protein n=1 Tax=Blautia liquoris TaxID=2779518 RepID=A0A7M2RGQ9_9FIRM|nr:S1 RNA-binding domain-containing protein [Blautia liquoris]QOV19429.1 S1 RNA-binding domain-containing protein [Blautia liquoris]
MAEEKMTMDEFNKAVDESFDSFKDEDQMVWEKLRQLKEDKTILDVTVDGIVNKGVVSYVEGIRGFIPASKLSLGRIEDLNEYLGKEIKVQVLDIDEQKNRLILSRRALLQAEEKEERKAKIDQIIVGTIMEGTVESIKPYGAFVDLGNHLSGLLHVSQISQNRIKDPSVVLNVGDPVKVKIIAIKDGKLSLSIKAIDDDAKKAEEDAVKNVKLPKAEDLTTNLGSLFKNIKL